MAQRWRKAKLQPDDLPLVVLWHEMLAATGMQPFRAAQLAREYRFPIKQLPYFGYHPRGRSPVGRNQLDVRGLAFAKVEVLRFLALSEYERDQATLLEWELPRCCHCPFHCPREGQAQEHPYASRFKRRWWNQ